MTSEWYSDPASKNWACRCRLPRECATTPISWMDLGAMTRTSVGSTDTTIMLVSATCRMSPSRRSAEPAGRRMPISLPWSVVTRWIRLTSSALGSTTFSRCRPAYSPASGGSSCRLPKTFSIITNSLLEEEVALGHGQHVGRLAGDVLAVDCHLVRLRVHRDVRRGIVVFQVGLGQGPDPGNRTDDLLQSQLFR